MLAIGGIASCNSAPRLNFDGGIEDGGSGVQGKDGGVTRTDGGLPFASACAVLNSNRCEYWVRCSLIEDTIQAREECARELSATWCGPQTWPNHVAKGALKYDALRAEACAESFAAQACGDWSMLSEPCQRFLSPRAALGQECYDGYPECSDGVCRGTACPRTCQPRSVLNESCTSTSECRSGLYCKFAVLVTDVGQCVAYGALGSPCENDVECSEGMLCISNQCRALPAPGSPCLNSQCSEIGFCAAIDGGTCVVRGALGASCTAHSECQSALACDPFTHLCVPLSPASGERCTLAQRCPSGQVCLGATTHTAGMCHLPQSEGGLCNTNFDCEGHLTCQSGDGGRSCQTRAPIGAACNSAQSCQHGSVCTDSICTALPLPGQSCAQARVCRWGLCRELANTDGGAVCGALLSAGQRCQRNSDCASDSCVGGMCSARCVP